MVDQLSEEPQVFLIPDFLGGVQSYPIYSRTPLNSLERAKNAIYDKAGFLVRRPGLDEEIGNLANTPNDFHMGLLVAGFADERKIYELVKRIPGTNFYLTAYDGTARSTINLQTGGNFTAPLGMTWVRESSGSEFIYTANFSGDVIKHSVETAAVDPVVTVFANVNASPPQDCRFLLNFLDRVWAAGIQNTDRDKLFYSNNLAPETWDRSIQVISFEGESITALSRFKNNTIFIGLERSMYLLSVGQSNVVLDWEKRELASDIGVGPGFSVAFGRDDLFFMDQNKNIRSLKNTISDLSAGVEPVPLSFVLKDDIIGITAGVGGIVNVLASWLDGKYFISGLIGSVVNGTNGQTWVFDSFLNAWTGPMTWNVSSGLGGAEVFAKHTGDDQFNASGQFQFEDKLFLGTNKSNGDKRLYKLDFDLFQDDEDGGTPTNIEVEILTRYHDFGFPQQEKTIRWIEVEYGDENNAFSGSGSFEVFFRESVDGSFTSLGTVSYTASTFLARTRLTMRPPLSPRARQFQFRFLDSSATDGPKVRRMWLSMIGHEVRDRAETTT